VDEEREDRNGAETGRWQRQVDRSAQRQDSEGRRQKARGIKEGYNGQ
jgi:hypothetical protein